MKKRELKLINPKVVQSNSFIRDSIFSKKLDINDIKLFKTIISKVNHNDSLFEDFYIINYDDLDIAGVQEKNRYQTINESLEKLANTYVTLKYEDIKRINPNITEEEDIRVGLIKNKFKYPRRTKAFKISIDEDLKPFLLELKKEYTRYDLENLCNLKTKTDIDLYELFASWKNKESFVVSIEDLREYLDLSESYSQYFTLKPKLKKHIDNIVKNTDLIILSTELNSKMKTLEFNKQKVEYIKFEVTDRFGYKSYNLNDLELKRILAPVKGIDSIFRILKILEKDGLYNLSLFNEEKNSIADLGSYVPREELLKKITPLLIKE